MKNKKLSTKILSFIMTFLVLAISLPIYAFASAIDTKAENEETIEETINSAQAISDELYVLEEDVSLREENAKHFKLSDGTMKAVSYAQAVHYKDENDSWIDIDNSLTLSGSEYATSNKQEIKFANKSGSNGLISIKDGEYKIDFTPLNTNKVSVEIENPEGNNSRKFDDVKKLNKLVSKATYKDIYSGIDLEYILVGNNIKENIIVKEKQSEYSFSFEIKLNKLNAELENNVVVLTDSKTGEKVYEIPAPYMLDANGEYSDSVEYTLTKDSKWKYTLTVVADPSWINAEEREFPVKIDPTVGVATSVITDATEYSNSINGDGVLMVGDGNKTQISFSSIPALPKDAYLTDAQISLNCISGTGTYIGVYQYNTEDICDYNEITNTGWYTWNIYDIVYSWYNNSQIKCFELRAVEGTSTIQFDSKETNSSNRPIFEITYRDMKGLEPYWSYLTQSAGLAGSGAVNLATGNLVFEIPTMSTTDSLFGFTPSMIYNSAIAGEAYKYGNAQIGYWGSYAANGFKVNYNEALIKDSYTNSNGESEIYYIWADSDGTEHYFFNAGEENVYHDEDGLQLTLTVNDDDITQNCIITDSSFSQRVFAHISGTVSTEIEASWYLSKILDKNSNAIYFQIDGSKRPNDVKIIPNGGSAITMISPLYNSNSAVTLFWNNSTKEAVLLRHSTTPTSNALSITNGLYLKEALHLKCDSTISWRDVLNFDVENDSETDGITIIAKMQYDYDSDGRLYFVHNDLSKYTLWYYYDEAGRIEEILEVGDESGDSDVNGAGQNIKISYYPGYTEVQTSGSDDIFGTDDDLINVYVFDNQGRAVTTYTTNKEKTVVYGAVSGEYVKDNENAKNNLKSTVTTGNTSPNYLLNGNFELSQTSAVYWETEGNVVFPIDSSHTTEEWNDSYLVLLVGSNQTSTAFQTVSLYPGDYTLSLDLLTYASKNLTINLKAIAQDVSNEVHTEQIAVNETFASGSDNFASLSFSVEGTEGVARPYKIAVSLYGNETVSEESINIDNVMLAKASGAQEYSWVNNGSFEQSYDAPESGVGFWGRPLYTTIVSENNGFNKSIRISGDISSERGTSQTIYEVSQATIDDFNLKDGEFGRCNETTFIFSGFGKATEAMRNNKSKFSIIAEIYCYEENDVNSTIISKELAFNTSTDGWQYVSGMITVPEASFVKYIKLRCVYSNNVGEAYFDNIKFELCDYETPTVVEYEYYEDSGKIMSQKVGYNMTYYDYNDDGELTDVISKNSHVEYVYDNNHNVVEEKQYEFDTRIPYKSDFQTAYSAISDSQSLIVTTVYSYNAYGLLEQTTTTNAKDSSTLTTSATYNTSSGSKIFGALQTTTDSLGNVTRYFYNQSNGYLLYEIGADNTGYYYTYDSVGNLISVQPATYTTTPSAVTGTTEIEYEYNEKYQIEKIIANGTEYTITYDIFGNQSSVSIGENLIVSQQYNSYNGKLASVTYASGTVVSYEYDNLERISKTTCTNGETSYSYEYTYDSNGNVTKFVDGKNNKATIYSYDLKGRLVKSIAYNTENMVNESSVEYNYDENNMLSNVWYAFDYTYNSTSSEALFYNYGYAYTDENDALTVLGIDFANTTVADINYSYDNWDRLSNKNIVFAGASNTVSYKYKESSILVTEYESTVKKDSVIVAGKTYKYTYDNANLNITEIRDANGNLLQKYTYDSLDRLIREDNSQTGKTYVFTYDNNGNILSEKIYDYTTGSLDSVTPENTYTYGYTNENWKDQLTSYNGGNIVYDAMGNPITYWDNSSLTWDIEGNLASLNKGSLSVSYKYNSAGIRTEKTVNGVTHYYTLDGSKILYESYGNVLIVYLYDELDAPIGFAYRESSYAKDEFDIYLFTKNLQGDIIDIYTENGTIVASYTYDAWGNHTVTNHTADNIGILNPFRYRGYYFDSETGYYYLNSRYYDPQVKRFISADAIGYLGANGDLISYNLYAYCSNNPVMHIDPSGTSLKDLWLSAQVLVLLAGEVIKIAWENVTAEAGICIGMGVETDISGVNVELISRADIIGAQLKDGEFKVGHPNKSAASIGVTEGLISVSVGTGTEGFESFDYSERPRKNVDPVNIDFGLSKSICFVIGFHYNISFSVSGFIKDIDERFF